MSTFTNIPNVFAGGIHAGIKADPQKLDLAYMYLPTAFATAGVFTRNQFPASSVTYTQKVLKKTPLKALIINSGNANAGTGEIGRQNTLKMARITAKALGVKPSQVGVASTGKIGQQLPMDKIESGILALLKTPEKKEGHKAATAILTTDLCTKEVYLEEKIGNRTLIVAGMIKGSGMIAPNMATTLGFLVTNVAIPQVALQKRLNWAIERSLNMVSVDTDTSTNDMLILSSVGTEKDMLTLTEEWDVFEKLLLEACIQMGKAIAKDGEGATRLIEVQVTGATRVTDARKIALNVVNSPLVKTAIHGADPNWGRVVAAACKDPDLKINTQKLELKFGDISVFSKGEPTAFDHAKAVETLSQDTVIIHLNLNLGHSEATAWGCDLTHGYVDINVQYC
jgi:glutamate N-acetyltransferase/amino-acid N-acetyltransferase